MAVRVAVLPTTTELPWGAAPAGTTTPAPYSVTTQWTCPRVVTTPAPGASSGTIRDSVPLAAVDGSAITGFPPGESAAPRMKSIWPPIPE